MNDQPLSAQEEARQRSELGGYSEAEFDREFVRSQRSDVVSVVVRVVLLLVVYGMLARAIQRFDPPPWLLMVPFVSELLAIFWIGWFLSRFVVTCKAFRKSAGSFLLVLFWTLLICGGMGAAIVFNPGGAGRAETPALAFGEAWQWLRRTDLHWALLAMLGTLLASTIQEVMRWKQERGVFVWAAIMTAGFRIGIGFLVAVIGGFVLVFAGKLLLPIIAEWMLVSGSATTWALYVLIVLVEVLTIVVSVLMHREATQPQAAKPAPIKRRRGALP